MNRAPEEVELVGEPKVQEAPPEVVVRALFTKETLADYLRVSVYTVQRLVQDGVLTAIKVGSQVRFHIDDVDRFLDQCRTGRPDDRSGRRRH
jgi:excisionase family DNA binding protein